MGQPDQGIGRSGFLIVPQIWPLAAETRLRKFSYFAVTSPQSDC